MTTHNSSFSQACDVINKRWNAWIIDFLMQGEKRFSEIAAEIPGISSRMLAQRLKELEDAQIVVRTVYPEIPVRIIYTLSERGYDLRGLLDAHRAWAERWYGHKS